jgi:uncharacterized protein
MKIIYEILYGSDAYGTTLNDSDRDIRGILLPSLDEALSMKELNDIRTEKRDKNGKMIEDQVMYPLQKFFRLAIKSNPAVFEWLFVPESCILYMHEKGRIIRENRSLFLSKELYHRFKGFALSEFQYILKWTGKTGKKRKEQIAAFGYSPKNAMNCIRILQQGIELLETANITMPRPNAKELIEIKKGTLKYKEIVNIFNETLTKLDKAFEKSKLPEKPRIEEADQLMIKILKMSEV